MLLALSAVVLMATGAKADEFIGSYTLSSGQVVEFHAEGTVQGDLDTVIIDSFLATPTFDSVAPLVTNPQFHSNTVSFSGDTLDLGWFGDGSVGFQLDSQHSFFASGPGYGNTQESLNDSFTLTTIPEPATLFDDNEGRSQGATDAQMRVAKDLFPAYDLKLPVTGEGILDKQAKNKLRNMTPAQRKAWHAAYKAKNAAFADAKLEGDALVKWKYQRYIKDYLRCVDALDDSVGQVMAFLKKHNLDENTILIYSSDQGFFLGEHGWYDKRWMYEPSLNTPLIVRWPGVTKPDSVCDAMVQNIDMAPTFLAMTGNEAPDTMQGASLVPWLKGETPASWRDAIYYHYHQRDSGRTSHMVSPHYGIRTRQHKLMYVYDRDTWELYDLANDSDEMHNLYDDPSQEDLVQSLKRKLTALRDQYGDNEGGTGS